MRRIFLAILIASIASLAAWGEGTTPTATPELWFYYETNLQEADNLVPLEAVFRRAAAAGYTQVYLTDSKFARLGTVPKDYFDNAAKVIKLAAELHLEIVPGIFPIGWSDALLSAVPNLVEALPVRDALFVVDKGVAHPVADPPVQLPGFTDPNQWAFVDPVVHFEDGVAHVFGAKGMQARAAINLPVAPFHQYDISFRIKSKGYTQHPMVEVLASADENISLNNADFTIKPTQDWTTYHVVFNSLEQKSVLISFRAGYSGSDGELWWDQPAIAEAGLLNIVRRDSCPLSVRLGGKVLVEGTDYEPVVDPKMGNETWPGSYGVWHEPPVLKTNLPDGAKLRVSFCHAITTGEGKVSICLSEPKTNELLRDQAKRVDAIFHAKRYFMEHDEIRVLGWDDSCEKTGLDSGAILAANLRTCIQIMKEINPDATLYVWSDMFDPFHNAHDKYYLVRGNLAGSWEGLAPSVVVANWNSDDPAHSLPWFAQRGNHQLLAGYYDGDPGAIVKWLKAAHGIPNIDAVMYTTWENKYGDLEAFAKAVRGFR